MSFTFGSQPTGNSLFGQTPAFGTSQPFGGATTAPTATLQFGSAYGAGAPATNFGTAAPLFGQAQAGAFSLGAATSIPSSTFAAPGLFGTATALPNTGLTFGAAAATSAVPAFGSGLSFATPATSAPAFGTLASTVPSFGLGSTFGTSASTQNTGLTYGTPAAIPSTGLTFGLPASTGLTLGTTPAAPTTGIAFGSTSAPITGLTFGPPVTFGAPPNTGLPFGTTPATTGLTFGTAAPFNLVPSTASSGLPLGSTTSMPSLSLGSGTSLNFGITPVVQPVAPTTALTFTPQTATTSVPMTNLTFNAASTLPSSGLSFSTSATTAKTTTGLSFTTPTFSLGTTTINTTSTPLNFNNLFASTTLTTAAPSNTGFGIATTSAAPSIGLGGIPTTKAPTTTTLQLGLGGISTMPNLTVASTTTTQGELPPKDQPLPNELLQTVDAFKVFLKEQRTSSSEISRFSMKELKTVETNITNVNKTINDLENNLQKNKCTAEKLKLDTAQALHYAEMAQRTFEIPAGMQYGNTVPIQFFVQLLQDFERNLQQLRFHLEFINKQVKSDNSSSNLTPEDLALGLRRLHQTFVTLAGRLQTVHSQVEIQKGNYLRLRKDILNDSSSVFQSQNKELNALEYALKSIANENKLPDVVAGPSPFNSLGTGQAQLLAQNPPPAYPGTSLGQTTLNISGQTGINAKPIFGTALGNTSSLFNSPTSNSFQLQKPPTGSKRGKT